MQRANLLVRSASALTPGLQCMRGDGSSVQRRASACEFPVVTPHFYWRAAGTAPQPLRPPAFELLRHSERSECPGCVRGVCMVQHSAPLSHAALCMKLRGRARQRAREALQERVQAARQVCALGLRAGGLHSLKCPTASPRIPYQAVSEHVRKRRLSYVQGS